MAVDVKQVVPLVDVQDVNKSPMVYPGCTRVGYGNKQERDRQASSSENDGDLDAEVLETEAISDKLIQTIDIV